MALFTEQLSVLFDWVIRTSIQASVLVGLIMVVQMLARRRLAPKWIYCLWLILLVRLLMPFAPESALSVFNLLPFGQEAPTVPQIAMAPAPVVPEPLPPVPIEFTVGSAESAPQPYRPPVPVEPLPLIWLAGALVIAAYALGQNYALSSRVSRHRPVTDQTILDLLEDCKTTMGVRSFLNVVETSKVKSPALLGFVRPRLLLPEGMIGSLSRDELRYVFLHELAHLRRHDIPLNWLMTLLQVIHWFNPLIWFAFYRLRADREVACDALVLSRTRPDESQRYGRTIVTLLERFSQPRRLPGLAGILENKSQLKRRITMIALFKKPSYRWSTVAALLMAVLGCLALTDAKRRADEGPFSPAREEMEEKLDRAVDLHFERSSIAEIIEFLERMVGINIVIDERVIVYPDMPPDTALTGRGGITPTIDPEVRGILVTDIPLRDALRALTNQVGLDYLVTDYFVWVSRPDVIEREGKRIRYMPTSGLPETETEQNLDRRIDANFSRGSIAEIIQFLARTVGINIILDQRVVTHPNEPMRSASAGQVFPKTDPNIHGILLQDIPLRHALKALVGKLGLDYIVTEHFVWISRPDVLASEQHKFDELRRPLSGVSDEMAEKLNKSVDFNFSSGNIREITEFISRTPIGVNIVIDERVMIDGDRSSQPAGAIVPTIDPFVAGILITDMPLRHALKALLVSMGLDYRVEEHYITVSRSDVLGTEPPRAARVMRLTGRVVSELTSTPLRYTDIRCLKDGQQVARRILWNTDSFEFVFAPSAPTEPGTYEIRYRSLLSEDPRAVRSQEVKLRKGRETQVELTLPEPFSFSVHVVDGEGNPVPNVLVGLRFMRPDNEWVSYEKFRTDRNGRFTFSEFVRGVVSGLIIRPEEGYTFAESRTKHGRDGGDYQDRVVLHRLVGGVTGTLVEEDDEGERKPVRHGLFSLTARFDDGEYAVCQIRTDREGKFTKTAGRPGRKVTLELRQIGGWQQLYWISEPMDIAPDQILDLGEIVLISARDKPRMGRPARDTEKEEPEDRTARFTLDSIQMAENKPMAFIRTKRGRTYFVGVGRTFESDFKVTNIDTDRQTVDIYDSETEKTSTLSVSDSKRAPAEGKDADADRPRFVVLEKEDIEEKLDTSVDIVFKEVDVREMLAHIEDTEGIEILVDERVLLDPDESDESDELDEPETSTHTGGITPTVDPKIRGILLEDVPLGSALKAILSQIGLAYHVEDHFIWISRPDVLMREQSGELQTRYWSFKTTDEKVVDELRATLEEIGLEITDPDTGLVISYMGYDPAQTMIIIHNRPSNLQKLEQIMKRFTEEPEEESDKADTSGGTSSEGSA